MRYLTVSSIPVPDSKNCLRSASAKQHHGHPWQEQRPPTQPCKCLAVKRGAEVADLSEPMRLALQQGTTRIIGCLNSVLERGQAHGSLQLREPSGLLAAQLYALWLGASVMAKITRIPAPLNRH